MLALPFRKVFIGAFALLVVGLVAFPPTPSRAQEETVRRLLIEALPPKIEGTGLYREPLLTGKPCEDEKILKPWLEDLRRHRLEIMDQHEREAPVLKARRVELKRELDTRYNELVRSSEAAQGILALAREEKERLLAARDQCVELRDLAVQNAIATFDAKYNKYMRDDAAAAKEIMAKRKEMARRCVGMLHKKESAINKNEQRIDQIKQRMRGFENRSLGRSEEREWKALERELTNLTRQNDRMKQDVTLIRGSLEDGNTVTARDVKAYVKERGKKFQLIKQRLRSHEQKVLKNTARLQTIQKEIQAYDKKWAGVGPNSRGWSDEHRKDYDRVTSMMQESKLLESQNKKLGRLVEGYRHVTAQEGLTYSWTKAVSAEDIQAMQADLFDAASFEKTPEQKKKLEELGSKWLQGDDEWAAKIAAQAFLGMDPAILTSQNPEAILEEMSPAFKIEHMNSLIAMYEQMAHGMDEAVRGYIESKFMDTRGLKQEIRNLDSSLEGRERRIKRLGEAYMDWMRSYKGNRRACGELRRYHRPVRIDYSNRASLQPADRSAWKVKQGDVLASVSGAWKEQDHFDPPHAHGSFLVPYGGKLHGMIKASPPGRNQWSLGNSDTGLVVTFEPRLGTGYGPPQKVLAIGGLMIDHEGKPLEGDGEWFGEGRLTVSCPAPGGSGPLTGGQFKQSYSGTVTVTEIYPARPASAGTKLGPGDHLTTEPGGELHLSTPHSTVWLGPNSDVKILQLETREKPYDIFELRAGKTRIFEVPPEVRTERRDPKTKLQLQLKGLIDEKTKQAQPGPVYTITPRGTDYEVEHQGEKARVRVFEGALSIAGPNGESVELKAGQMVDLPGGTPTPLDAPGKPITVQGLPVRDIPIEDDLPQWYGATTAELDEKGRLLGDWIWQDPGDDAKIESPEPGTLRITVPPGNEFWAGNGSAPRLLHKVTGDFDLQCELQMECKGRHFAITEFVLYSPGSYIGTLAKQSDDPLLCHYRLLGGGWSQFSNRSKLGIFQRSELEGIDIPEKPIHLRLRRRGKVFETLWSLDGKKWNLSGRTELDVHETLWTGLLFKRVVHDGLPQEPAVNTVHRLRLSSDVQMPSDPWRFAWFNAEAEWNPATDTVRLALDNTNHGYVTAIHGRTLEGDVDLIVRYTLDGWKHEPGQGRELSVGLSALDEQNTIYAGFFQIDAEARCYRRSDMQINRGWGRYVRQEVPSPSKSGYFRITRRKGVCRTFHWREGAWHPLGAYDTGFKQPALLTLRIANNERSRKPSALSATFHVERMLDGEAAAQAPPWLPIDLNVWSEAAPPKSLRLPPDMVARMWRSPYPLGRVFCRDSEAFIPSLARDRAKLVRLGEDGQNRVAMESKIWIGLNNKGTAFDGEDLLVVVDYDPRAGSFERDLNRLKPDGTYAPMKLSQSHGDMGDIVAGPSGVWFFSDFGQDQVFRLDLATGKETPLITKGDKPQGPLDLAWDDATGALYVLNVEGNYPFGGPSAVYRIEGDSARRVLRAREGTRLVGMAFCPGGPLGQGLIVLDSAGRLIRLGADGRPAVVASGLNDFHQTECDSRGTLLAVGGEQNDLLLRIERLPSARDEAPSATSVRPAPPVVQPNRGYVGVNTAEVNSPEARALGVTASHGAVLVKIYPNSPAAAAGLRPGDVIRGCGGRPVNKRADLSAILGAGRPGQTFMLEVQTGGAMASYRLTLGNW
ncbi:MAG: PDZ domain-containing protein, partial [Pirellulales bacterium]|nr:PDZ domain-containing protein [Pirellulales bacterium]